jgi:hypothetical protein
MAKYLGCDKNIFCCMLIFGYLLHHRVRYCLRHQIKAIGNFQYKAVTRKSRLFQPSLSYEVFYYGGELLDFIRRFWINFFASPKKNIAEGLIRKNRK